MNFLIESFNTLGSRFAGFALPMLVQSGCLIALLLLVNAFLRKRVRATIRYALWMLVPIKLLLPATLTLPTSPAYWVPQHASSGQIAKEPVAGPVPVVQGIPAAASTVFEPAPVIIQTEPSRPVLTWRAILFIGWAAGFLCLTFYVFRRIRTVTRMLKKTTEAPGGIVDLLNSCRDQLGIKQEIVLRYSSEQGSPAICGLFKPVIVIPASLPGTLSESNMRSILLHELAHFRRGDLWIGHLQIALQLFYWYNPFVWLANKQIQQTREQAVDEVVLFELREEAEAYPATLVQVAKMVLERPPFSIGFIGILESSRGLRDRIQHMLNHPVPSTTRIGIRGLIFVFLMAVVALPMASKTSDEATKPSQRSVDTLKTNSNLPAIEAEKVDKTIETNPNSKGWTPIGKPAQELETRLQNTPGDIETRKQLLTYYSAEQFKSATARKARQGHILWLIEHQPDVSINLPSIRLNRILDGAAYEQGKALWLKQVQNNPTNLVILEHASDYLLIQDRSDAEALLKKAQATEPNNPRWAEKLSHLYSLNGNNGDTHSAEKALAEMEKTLTLNTNASFSNLGLLAKLAFAAGNMQKASGYATELLKQVPQNRSEWNYGNALFDGNLVLGRIALREGKIEAAKKYLLEAGKTPGSPVLNSFGPNMSLAKELLEKGEKETVLAYFIECAAFWNTGKAKLDAWTQVVKDGKVPDFAASLVY